MKNIDINNIENTTVEGIVVVFHPNDERVDIVAQDFNFNQEQYSFSRKEKPVGNEKILLDRISKIVGIHRVEATKNELNLEVSSFVDPKKYIPQVISYIEEFRIAIYNSSVILKFEVYQQNRRKVIPPEYDEDGWCTNPGVTEGPIDIGIPFKIWGK